MPLYFGIIFAPDPHRSGQYIITEGNFFASRGAVMLKGGAGLLAAGTVLGRIAGGADAGLCVPSPASAADGSDAACAVLFEDTDATSVNVLAGATVGGADVYGGALIYDKSVAGPAAIATKARQLAAVGINVRDDDDPDARVENNWRMTTGY